MQMTLTRSEIRTQKRAMMGQQTAVAVSGIINAQDDAMMDAAYLKALGDSTWVSTEGRQTVDLTTGQYLLDYPTDAGPGSIVELAVCDPVDGQYRAMRSSQLPAVMDFDVIEGLGGADFEAIQGEPVFWQQRGDGIFLYPPNDDTARKVRVRFNKRRRFTAEGESSLCDGQLILYWFLALAYGDHDPAQRAFYQDLYADRLCTLRAWQHTGESVTFRDDSPVLDNQDAQRPVPNWDTRPRA